jgi:hypothetical protein
MLIILAACGPSQADLDAAATGSAAETSAAQTAGAPTPTQKPTDTQIPTSTPTAVLPAATPTPVPPTLVSKSPDKILFIGLDLWNERHTEAMAASADPPSVVEVDTVQWMGSLDLFWIESEAREVIGTGDYDVVVLVENLHHAPVNLFREYAGKFDAEIKQSGAETVLFMQWPAEGSRQELITYEEIAQAHDDVAAELGAEVSPVALAWQRASEERPDLELFEVEWEEPSIYGKYLTINVLYATLFGESPVDLAYLPEEFEEMTEEEAAFLQRIALETVLEYQMK